MGSFERWAFGRLAGMAAAAAIALGAGSVQAAPCTQPNEHAALSARVLQSQLMVGALSCGDRTFYNAFARKYERELVARGRAMQAFFSRAYGGGGASQMNRFVTVLANDASARSRSAPNFCNDTRVLFETLLQVEPARLNEVVASQSFTGTHGYASCQKPGGVTTAAVTPKTGTAAKDTAKAGQGKKDAKAKDTKSGKDTKDTKTTKGNGKDTKTTRTTGAKAAQAADPATGKTARN